METCDSNAIKFSGHPNAETYLALTKTIRNQKSWSTSGRVVIGLVAIAATGILVKNGIPSLVALGIILFLIGLVSLIPSLARRRVDKKQKSIYSERLLKLERTGSISPNGIYIKFTDCQTELRWSYFDKVVEIDGAVGLCKDSQLIDTISRSMLESESSWDAARRIILEKVPGSVKNSAAANQ